MILVTGASGFIGRALIPVLTADTLKTGGGPVVAAPRDAVLAALPGARTVIHLAARVHVMRETEADPLRAFRTVNFEFTRTLAEAAASGGVQRFIFVSTAKVNGESTTGRPFRSSDIPQPSDPYALSKWEAEQELARIAATSGMEVVILRPPLVYGPEVKGNFLSLLKICRLAPPLPLAAIANRRSLLYRGNFVDAIRTVTRAPVRGGCQTYLLRDGRDLSTPELLRALAAALGRPSRLFPVPPRLLYAAAVLLGKKGVAQRLFDSLAVDDQPFRDRFAWTPPHSVEEGLAATAEWFRQGGATPAPRNDPGADIHVRPQIHTTDRKAALSRDA